MSHQFRPGDRVEVIAGPHVGAVTTIDRSFAGGEEMSACDVCGKCPCHEHERKTVMVAPPVERVGEAEEPALLRRLRGLRGSIVRYSIDTDDAQIRELIQWADRSRPAQTQPAELLEAHGDAIVRALSWLEHDSITVERETKEALEAVQAAMAQTQPAGGGEERESFRRDEPVLAWTGFEWIPATYEFKIKNSMPLGWYSVMRADGGGRLVVKAVKQFDARKGTP